MVYQTGRQVSVTFAEETTYGTLATATDGKVFRPNTGNLTLSKELINSNENRRDGMMSRGRHGSRSVTGQYTGDLSVGSYDEWVEAVFRGTFDTALSIDESTAAMSTATLSVASNVITASAGSFITAGVRVGDVIRLTAGFAAGNMNRNLRVTAVTATTVTVADDIEDEAGPLSTYTIERPRKVLQGTTARSFTVEEREIDIDSSEVFTGVRVGQFQIALQPNNMATVTFNLVGQDGQLMEGADSPYFTDPTETTTIGLTAVEAKIRLGTEDVLDVSSVDLSVNLNAAGNPVVGSNLTPDVFTNLANVTGSVTALKSDATRMQQFLDEDELSLHMLFEDPDGDGFVSVFVGNLTLGSATKSDLGSDGARTASFDLVVGKDVRGGAYDATAIKFQTSSVAA